MQHGIRRVCTSPGGLPVLRPSKIRRPDCEKVAPSFPCPSNCRKCHVIRAFPRARFAGSQESTGQARPDINAADDKSGGGWRGERSSALKTAEERETNQGRRGHETREHHAEVHGPSCLQLNSTGSRTAARQQAEGSAPGCLATCRCLLGRPCRRWSWLVGGGFAGTSPRAPRRRPHGTWCFAR